MDWQIILKASLFKQMASLIWLECFKRPPWPEEKRLEERDIAAIHLVAFTPLGISCPQWHRHKVGRCEDSLSCRVFSRAFCLGPKKPVQTRFQCWTWRSVSPRWAYCSLISYFIEKQVNFWSLLAKVIVNQGNMGNEFQGCSEVYRYLLHDQMLKS